MYFVKILNGIENNQIYSTEYSSKEMTCYFVSNIFLYIYDIFLYSGGSDQVLNISSLVQAKLRLQYRNPSFSATGLVNLWRVTSFTSPV